MTWWVHDLWQNGTPGRIILVSWIFWVLLSITLHELAHGWAALWQGDDTPRRLDRMTFNPVVHMGPMALIFFLVIGITWGVMPVDPSRFRSGRRGRVYVSGAGPAMNILIALVTGILLVAWLAVGPQGTDGFVNITRFLWTGCWLNVLLAMLNLLPIPPLDGASVLSGLSLRMYRLYQHPNVATFGFAALLLIFFTGIFDFFFSAGREFARLAIDLAGTPLGNPRLGAVL